MSLRRAGRLKLVEPDTGREPRTVPAVGTALFHGALLEINRLGAEVARLTHENHELRARLVTRLTPRADRLADLRDDHTRGDAS